MVINFNDWKAKILENSLILPSGFMYDFSGAEELEPITIGFMVAPVTRHNGNLIESISTKVTDLAEFRNNFVRNKQSIYLYQVLLSVDGGFWVVRYHEATGSDRKKISKEKSE